MALKTKNNQYIKIELDGTVLVYSNITARELEKKSTPYTKIILKYKKIITKFKQNKERYYYDAEYYQLVNNWETEYHNYLASHTQGKRLSEFPLMSQYFPDIKNSLPNVFTFGQIGIQASSLSEIYTEVKKYRYFGEVEDC